MTQFSETSTSAISQKHPFFSALSRFIQQLKTEFPQSADWEIKEIFKKITGKRPIDFIIEDSYPVDAQLQEIQAIIEKRVCHYPIAHLLETCEFMENDLFVNSGTFIPRPETELLVKEAITFAGERFRDLPEPYAVDLGTGSGCITVSFLKKMPNWHVTAFELSQEAVQSARTNIGQNGLDLQAVVIHKNYFDAEWTDAEGNFPQLILVNPPYISENDYQALPAEVQKEPYAALIGGEKGYEIPQQILRLSAQRLAPNGLVIMEIGAGQSAALRTFADSTGLKVNRIIKDEQGHDRIMIFEVQHG